MKLSDRGVDFIISFEGLLRKIGPGKYIAYRCPAGIWTIYAGCTEGVKEGTIWTEEQGKAAFKTELAKHEAAVRRLVAVDLNQNQFDALVSFSYNVGWGALSRSTLLKKLNKGDFPGAQAEFMKWNKAAGKQLRGLSRRRAAEAALFAERVEEENTEPQMMPQAVDAPKEPMSEATKGTLYTAGAATGTAVVSSLISAPASVPAPPAGITDAVSNIGLWQSIGQSMIEFASFGWKNPAMTAALVVVIAAIWLAPKLIGREA